MVPIISDFIKSRQEHINKQYRERLIQTDFSLICSNCFGGIFYHWLGIRFNTPFINLWLNNDDFIKAIANWPAFLSHPIIEDKNSIEPYPVGIGLSGIKIYFQHYSCFDEAIEKWERRKTRINRSKTVFMLTNWGRGKQYSGKLQ